MADEEKAEGGVRIPSSLLPYLLALLLGGGGGLAGHYLSPPPAGVALHEEIERLDGRLTIAEAKVEQLRIDTGKTDTRLDGIDRQLTEIGANVKSVGEKLDDLRARRK